MLSHRVGMCTYVCRYMQCLHTWMIHYTKVYCFTTPSLGVSSPCSTSPCLPPLPISLSLPHSPPTLYSLTHYSLTNSSLTNSSLTNSSLSLPPPISPPSISYLSPVPSLPPSLLPSPLSISLISSCVYLFFFRFFTIISFLLTNTAICVNNSVSLCH